MTATQIARLHWQEMVWYGRTLSGALVIASLALTWLLGFDGIVGLWRS